MLKHFNDPNAFTECLNDVENIFKNIEEYNLNKEHKKMIVFYDMIADMLGNKNFVQQLLNYLSEVEK